jgi:hypothetical protein
MDSVIKHQDSSESPLQVWEMVSPNADLVKDLPIPGLLRCDCNGIGMTTCSDI